MNKSPESSSGGEISIYFASHEAGQCELTRYFQEQFGRDPSQEELDMLKQDHVNKKLFGEWLSRQLGEKQSEYQISRFKRKFKSEYPMFNTYSDILRLLTYGMNLDETHRLISHKSR